ncbi:MAG: peptidase [Burkholderiaceae bacterium]|nr:peptidase [Burkholderiaceae bacterium]
MKMEMNRLMRLILSLSLVAGLIAGCSTSPRTPAPVVERTVAAPQVAPAGYYIVQRGDTLNRIAHRHGHRVPELVEWNQLANPNDIKVGQMLRVQRNAAPVAGAPVAARPANAQTDSVSSNRTEVKPLAAATATGSGVNKTGPRGEKQPYSEPAKGAAKKTDAAPAALSAPAVAAATSPAKPVPITEASREAEVKPPVPTVADTTLGEKNEDGIVWMWPSDGRILATFQGKSKGIDIGGRKGQKVVAAADGKVRYVGALRGYGNLAIVMHNDNLQSVYAHNHKILVKEGQAVTRGQPIAEMGNTDTEVVKLHFEVRRQGKPVDPARYLPVR